MLDKICIEKAVFYACCDTLSAVALVELAIDKQAASIFMPIAARKHLNDLLDEYWTKIQIEFYNDATDTVFKALTE